MIQISEDLKKYIKTVEMVDKYLHIRDYKLAAAVIFTRRDISIYANKKPQYSELYEVLLKKIVDSNQELADPLESLSKEAIAK